MADVTVPRIAHNAASTTAESVELTEKVVAVSVTNKDGTNALYVKAYCGDVQATVDAAAVAGVVVAAANDSFYVGPNQTVTVHQGGRPQFVALSIIATAGTPAYAVTGTPWPQS